MNRMEAYLEKIREIASDPGCDWLAAQAQILNICEEGICAAAENRVEVKKLENAALRERGRALYWKVKAKEFKKIMLQALCRMVEGTDEEEDEEW